jgi:hypothetical protein
MEHIVPLRAIDKRTDIDEDDKIKLARKICFGRVPFGPNTPPSPNEPTLPTAHSRLHTLGHTASRVTQSGTDPSTLNPNPSVPDTLGHTTAPGNTVVPAVQVVVPPAASQSLSPVPSVLEPSDSPQTHSDTLKHDTARTNAEKLSPQSSVLETKPVTEVLPARRLSITKCLETATDRDAVHQYILKAIFRGNAEWMEASMKRNQDVWIESQEILRLIP